MATVSAQLERERDQLHERLRQQEEAAITAQHAVEEDRDQALARADAAAQAASAAHAQVRATANQLAMQRAGNEALLSAMQDADGEIAVLSASLCDARAAGDAQQAQLATERRRRVMAALRQSLDHRAGEARLLLLLHSQRQRIDETARELAAVRRAAAIAQNNPVLEGAWLARPTTPSEPEPKPEAESESESETPTIDPELVDAWKRDWLTAMAHCL
uniref:Uncharacterized protein n=1 Tax=Haptolina ericina TaxID=156174 RepID=A0A7S3AEP2_9EUKA